MPESPKRRLFFLKRRSDKRGAIAIEFALIFPVMLVVLAGIVEFASIMFSRHVMFYSAREAARGYVTGAAASTSETVTLAQNFLSEGNARGNFTVTAATDGLGTSSATITVTISTPMKDAALINAYPDVLVGDQTITASASMYVDESSSNNTSCGSKKGSCTATKSSSTSKSSSKKSSSKKSSSKKSSKSKK